MRTKPYLIGTLFIFFYYAQIMAQPFELDPKIKPIELLLMDDTENEGAKSITTAGEIKDNNLNYYYVKGHDVFQYIDVYVFSNYGNPKFKVELVKDNWKEVAESQNSGNSKDGIINFKLRTWGDFGFRIISDKPVFYTVIVYASAPMKEYLSSPFVKATKANTEKGSSVSNMETMDSNESTKDKPSNLWLYILIGALVLIVGVLLGKVLGSKKSLLILLFLTFGYVTNVSAQIGGGVTWDASSTRPGGDYEAWVRQQSDRNYGESIYGDVEQLKEGLSRLGKVGEMLGKVKDTYDNLKSYEDAYQGLGSCMNSATPPGQPRLPSFCSDSASDCGKCFLDAREKFNFARYQFEKLAAIYNCTKDYSDKAIALGDNVSGYHGISGLAWQTQKINIEKSVKELQQAVDKKYAELIKDLQDALMMLDECEAEHGIPDWYDRFGYMYYEFIQINYKRKD